MDKRNDRIQSTLRPYQIVIRNKLFFNFIEKIFKIDPEERENATNLLKDEFFKVKPEELNKRRRMLFSS
jgi:serine/threonine protein kinase